MTSRHRPASRGCGAADGAGAGRTGVIAHFKTVFLQRSETFIRLQIDSMPGFGHLAVCRSYHPNPVSGGIEHFVPPALDFLAGRSIRRMPATSGELGRRGVSLVHAHFGKDGWLATPISGRHRKLPLVVSFYGRDASAVLRIPVWKRRYERLFAEADRILVLSPHMAGLLEAAGCPGDRILIHSFGIDLPRFPFVRRDPPSGDPARLLFVGRLVPKKGLHTALRAVARLDRCELVVVGDGPGRAAASDLAAELGIACRVSFPGWLPREGVAELMAGCRALLVPSETGRDGDMEGTPTVIFEAMASGLPVIGTEHAGIPWQLDSGRCGSLVPEGDHEALAHAVEELLSPGGRWTSVTEAARARVEACFDASVQGGRLGDIYGELILSRNGSR